MQAATVLLLELSYGSIHFAEQKEISSKVKVLVRLLRTLGKEDKVAERAHRVAFDVFRNLASRFEIDISDMSQDDADSSETPASWHRPMAGDQDQLQQFLADGLNFCSGSGHQSMFTLPPNAYEGDSHMSEFEGTPPMMSGISEHSSGHAFGTVQDEVSPFFTEFLA
ncbi:hypothetical protein E8E12_011588 [Didymella heteroderae]|uniref:Uncharacterized protein n=1 Tax=Didymella heteroderae TaxID=1769908 RepID=A0A9P5C6G7_9PLEO|nr:hypothetical protein E8E12_011588 [Didymella heteroderae]